jgi:hypothetical protein
VTLAQGLYAKIPGLDAAPTPELREDPQRTLFRYTMSPEGGRIRKSWPLPKSSSARIASGLVSAPAPRLTEVSPSGCKKKTIFRKGVDDRVELMFWHCMSHGTCVGWHTMAFGEGRRDVVTSLYSFKAEPPEHLFYDFACNASVVSLNTLPEYYKDCKYMHDAFHYTEHKCSTAGSSKRISHLKGFNTSLMEEVCFAFGSEDTF